MKWKDRRRSVGKLSLWCHTRGVRSRESAVICGRSTRVVVDRRAEKLETSGVKIMKKKTCWERTMHFQGRVVLSLTCYFEVKA